MAGFRRTFAIEDFLAAGEILYWIREELEKEKKLDIDDEEYYKEEKGITEYALSAIMASRDKEEVEKNSIPSKSGRRLSFLGYEDDVKLCVKRNISENVGIYKDGKITLYK
jgi:2-phosphosulfolactate phosphatase